MGKQSTDAKILALNLRLLTEETEAHAEKGRAMAAEAARMLAEPHVSATDRITRVEEAVYDFLQDEALPRLSAEERVSFITSLLAVFDEGGAPILSCELLSLRTNIPERISYFRTVYTDEAYDGFATSMREPTVAYADAFFLSCEDVKNGEAGYCILPCENSDGVLGAMMALADRYELFRVGTYRAFHADGENATHFGLFAAGIPRVPKEAALLLRFSCDALDAGELAVHLAALSHLGLRLLRTEVCSSDEEEVLPFTQLCGLEQSALTATLLYLRIFAKRLTLRGLYEEI